MLISLFTTIFPTDLFLFCLIILFYLALAAGAIFGVVAFWIALRQLVHMIWYALTGRWHLIKVEAEQAKAELKEYKR